MLKKFEVQDVSSLPQILEFIRSNLTQLKLNSKEALRTELICEEALMKLIEHGDFSKNKFISVNVKKFLGNSSIELKVPGNEFDFYIDGGIAFSENEDDDDILEGIRNLLLRSFGNQIKYKNQRHCNTVTITTLRSQYSNLYRMLGALILAIVTGFVMKNFMPEEISAMINGNFLEPVRSVLLNCLKMCAIPIMFFSIVSSFSQVEGGNLSRMKRAGVKMFIYAIVNDIIAVCIGIVIVFIFDIGKRMNLTALSSSTSSEAAQNFSFSIGDTINGFIPDNFLKPFLEGNMLQLMVLAILVGTALAAGNFKIIIFVFDEINGLFIKIIEMFLRFVPLLVFCSIASMLISTGYETLLLVLGILLVFFAANVLILVIYCLMIAFIARLNPAVMFKKSVSLMITAFTTCSTTTAIPDGMKTSKQLGISEKIYSLLIPLGTFICKNCFCLFLSVLTLSIANIYGIEITLSKIFLIGFYSILLPMAMPSIPSVGIVSLSSMFALTGCPLDGLYFAAVIDPITDMFHTTIMVIGVLTSTLIVAKSENLLDSEKYKS